MNGAVVELCTTATIPQCLHRMDRDNYIFIFITVVTYDYKYKPFSHNS
jgi:hypothetical protein